MTELKKNGESAPGEYYHVYNRGVMKREIFCDNRDWIRFLFTILHFQSPTISFDNLGRSVSNYVRHSMFNISKETTLEIASTKSVSLLAFTLMPNHFHLLLEELEDGGIAKYLQRIGNSYTKYFNTKYNLSGHLFQSRYQSVHITNNDQFLYTSAYVHKHHSKIGASGSSYQDYAGSNRWSDLLDLSPILDQFDNSKEYITWLKSCPAKEIKEIDDLVGHSMSNN